MDAIIGIVERAVALVERVSRLFALLAGLLLMAAVALVVLEIVLRRLFNTSLGGAHELSGYVLALVASWGFAYALVQKAHVRIDVVYVKLSDRMRAAFDVVALVSLALVSLLMAVRGWDVLATSLAQGSAANTPLETPLWIPQTAWFVGYVWFAFAVFVLLVRVLLALAVGDRARVSALAGSRTLEQEIEAESGVTMPSRLPNETKA